MSKANKPSKVLRTAIRRLQRFGWTKNRLVAKQGSQAVGYCLIGSIYGENGQQVGRRNLAPLLQAEKYVQEVVTEQFGKTGVHSIPSVNDGILQSPEDAILILKHALVKAETDEDMAKDSRPVV